MGWAHTCAQVSSGERCQGRSGTSFPEALAPSKPNVGMKDPHLLHPSRCPSEQRENKTVREQTPLAPPAQNFLQKQKFGGWGRTKPRRDTLGETQARNKVRSSKEEPSTAACVLCAHLEHSQHCNLILHSKTINRVQSGNDYLIQA